LAVSIHAFRGEGDAPSATPTRARLVFQSTPSGGKATSTLINVSAVGDWCFNPRLPGGRRRAISALGGVYERCFNPRLPGGRRPVLLVVNLRRPRVSIHAFRGEGDSPTNALV